MWWRDKVRGYYRDFHHFFIFLHESSTAAMKAVSEKNKTSWRKRCQTRHYCKEDAIDEIDSSGFFAVFDCLSAQNIRAQTFIKVLVYFGISGNYA